MKEIKVKKNRIFSLILIVFFSFLTISNSLSANNKTLSGWDSFSVKLYCFFNQVACRPIQPPSTTNNSTTLANQITSLQNQINQNKQDLDKSLSNLSYINPNNQDKVTYTLQTIKGDKGEKGDQGEPGKTIYINNNTATQTWASIGTQPSSYQYVPVSGPAGANGVSGANGKDGNYITLITQDPIYTTYYLFDPNTISTSTILVPNSGNSSTSSSTISTSTILNLITNSLTFSSTTNQIVSDISGKTATITIDTLNNLNLTGTTTGESFIGNLFKGITGIFTNLFASTTKTDNLQATNATITNLYANNLATVAYSGNYNDLSNKPSIPAPQINSDWNATSGLAQILNKPTIPTNTNQLTNGSGFITSSYVTWTNVSGKPTFATVATSGDYNDLSNRPTLLSQFTNDTNFTTINDSVSASTTTYSSSKINALLSGGGFGDMLKSVYDPTNVNADAFNYNNLYNKPSIPAAQINSDWNATTGLAQILNKPTIPTNNNQLTNGSGFITRNSLSATTPLSYSTSTGIFSISQANGSTNGYLSSTDWNTFNNKQATLVSGTNIKTINGNSLLGSGDVTTASSPISIGTSGNTLYSSGLTGTGQGNISTGYNIFFGVSSGGGANSTEYSNFLGFSTGNGAINADNSNFLGSSAGASATNANNSNFLGSGTGYGATNANNSNFLGSSAGLGATNANNSNFLGSSAGNNANSASYSTLIGYNVGNENSSGIHMGSNNIVIGTSISLPNAATNSMNLGGVLFGTGTYSNTIGNPTTTAVAGGRIGIGTNAPGYTLDVAGTGQFTGALKIGAYTLPNTDGTANQVLKTNGSGVVSWATSTGGGISLTDLSATSPLTYNNTTGVFGITQANTSTNGYLSSTDWNTFNNKQNTITGGASSITTSNLTANRALLSDASGKVAVSSVTNTELGYVSGVTSSIQTQLNGKQSTLVSGTNIKTVNGNSLLGSGDLIIVGGNLKYASSSYIGISSGPSGNGTSGGIVGATFIGENAGLSVTTGTSSNYIGYEAGKNATVSSYSNFLGYQAGLSASNVYGVNYFGPEAGSGATNAQYANFFGDSAGYGATNAQYSNFFGPQAGYNASSSSYSNFFGINTGRNTAATQANFFGQSAGDNAINASYSNFFGSNAGNTASYASNSNFFGLEAGNTATYASNSNFFGTEAGKSASYASNSNFVGFNSGKGATNSSYSNFFGSSAGLNSTDSTYSNFFGANAGSGATNASYSNFIGSNAGTNATSASSSNFIGNYSGYGATQANNSNFIGSYAGNNAINANNSTFIGNNSGNNAANSFNSFFAGENAGRYNGSLGSNKAANSIFIGTGSGFTASDTILNNTGSYDDSTTFASTSILIGHKTSTGGYSNSIAIGAYALNTESNQFMIGSTKRPINQLVLNGINPYFNFGTTTGSAGYGFRDNAGIMEFKNATGTWLAFATSSGGGGGISLTDLSATSPLTYNNTTGVFGINQASSTANGYLSSTDWTTFNNKFTLPALTAGSVVFSNGSTLTQDNANLFWNDSTNRLGIGTTTPINTLDVAGKIGVQGMAMIYVPDQTNYTGTVYFGNGGGSLSHTLDQDGFYNTAIGINALYSNTTGNQNVAQGYGALYSNLDGNRNIGQGFGTLYSNTSGYDNLAQGNNALFYNTTGNKNVAQGTFALRYNVSGSYNTVTGFQAGYGIAGSSTVSGNSLFGYQSGFTLQTGGDQNSLFGYQAGYNLSTGAYNIAIGQNVDLPTTNGSQQLNIGNLIFGTGVYNGSTPTSTSVTNGKVGIGINNPAYTLDVNYTASGTVARFTNSNGNCQINPTSASLICSSDINLKKNINLLNELTISTNTIPFTLDTNIATNSLSILDKILTLTPVTYNWKGEANTDNTHTGFIAQQVEQLFSDLVSTDANGMKGVNYVGFAPYLVASLQATMNTLNGKDALLNISSNNTDDTINLITNEDNIDVIQAIQDRLSNGYEVITNFVALRVTAIRGYFVKLYSDLIETKKLCLINDNGDKVCTNANQLQNLLNNQNNSTNNSNSGNTTNTENTDTNSTENGTTTDNGTTDNGTTTTETNNGSTTTETNTNDENTDLNNTGTTTTETNTDNNNTSNTNSTSDTTPTPTPTPTPEPDTTPTPETTSEPDNTEAGETTPTPTPEPTPAPDTTTTP